MNHVWQINKKFLTKYEALLIPFSLGFFAISSTTLLSTYADALFLSHYSRDWLTYLFFAQPVVMILVYFFASSFLATASGKTSFFFISGFSILLFLFYGLLYTDIYIVPFIFTILLGVLGDMILAMSWNAIASAFDIIEFKKYGFHINTLGTIAAILTAFISPVITIFFHLSGLFFFGIVINLIIAALLLYIKQIPSAPSKKSNTVQTELQKQPFFIYMCLLMILSLIIEGLSEYSFKVVLMNNYSQDGIAVFLSLFKGVVSIGGMVLQLLIAQRLIARVGLSGILLILPITTLILSGSLFIWPAFFLYVALRGSIKALKINFSAPGMEMIKSAYPTALRNKANFYLKGYVTPIGSLLAVPIIYVINHYIPLSYVGLIIAILAAVWIFILILIKKGYQDLLHSSLKEQRYSSGMISSSPEMLMLMAQENLKALESDDVDIIRSGLSFFTEVDATGYIDLHKLVPIVTNFLSNPHEDIRYKAVSVLWKYNAVEASPAILKQLKEETVPLVGWELVHTLLGLDDKCDATDYEFWLQSPYPHHIGYGLIVLDHSKKEDLQDLALQYMAKMQNGSVEDKLILARAQKYLKKSSEKAQRLCQLIDDEANNVSITAIQAVEPKSDSTLIPVLVNLLSEKNKAYYVQKALVKIGDRAVDDLVQQDADTPYLIRYGSISVLAQTLNNKSLKRLITLSQTEKSSIRLHIAHSIRQYMQLQSLDKPMIEHIIKMITWEAKTIQQLLQLHIPEDNEALRIEVDVQLRISREIFIVWLSLVVDHKAVASVEHYIINPQHADKSEIAKAYEFLDCLSSNAAIRRSISLISQNYDRKQPITAAGNRNPDLIVLAEYTPPSSKESAMNLLDKMILLRKVDLFQDVPFDVIQAIAEVSYEYDMAKNEYIFEDGEASECFYCIVSGSVEIRKGDKIFARLGVADYFGELGLLDDSPHAAHAIASEDGVLLYINKEEFICLLEDIPSVMHAVLKQVLKYLRVNIELVQQAALDKPQVEDATS
ncbi:MAG: cyclic nucleotide-binding domain-containing protein [Legionella sp.]|nr:cyclic nucleotide-binding domain-containing protein [Legionella sp.]